jgi:hypothetical protein
MMVAAGAMPGRMFDNAQSAQSSSWRIHDRTSVIGESLIRRIDSQQAHSGTVANDYWSTVLQPFVREEFKRRDNDA